MRILVTGGAGFIGSHVVDAYVKAGHEVMVIDNLSTGRRDLVNPKAQFLQVDITERENLKNTLAKFKPNVINHHAAQISVRISVENPILDTRINILGLLNLLEEAKDQGISSVIFASSGGAAYGEAKNIPTSEEYHPLAPLSPYGVAKVAGEHYLNCYYENYGIKYVCLRYSNVYGPRQNPHGEAGVVAIFSKKLLSKTQCTINGDGKQTRDYVYVGDVAKANVQALTSPFVGSVNIATGVETDVVTLFEKISRIVTIKLDPVFVAPKKGEQKRSCLSIGKAERVLGWKPQVSLEDGLKKTIAYFRHHE